MLVSILPLLRPALDSLTSMSLGLVSCCVLSFQVPSEISCVCSSRVEGGTRRGRGSGWQVWGQRHPCGAWEVTGTPSPHSSGTGSTVLLPCPPGPACWGHRAAFPQGMLCQSSVILLLLGILVGRQHLVPGTALAAGSCSCCVLTSFSDFFSPHPCKKGKPKTSQNHLPPWLKVQIEGFFFFFCFSKQDHSVLEYHCGVFLIETGSTKSHFSSQHRQKVTERDLGSSPVCGGRLLKEVLLL